MDIVIAVVVLGIAEVALLTLALRAFDRAEERRAPDGLPAPVKRDQPAARFFADGGSAIPSNKAPLEALLLQLERHVRAEQAAAESFLHNPTAESLHHRSSPPFRMVN